MTLTVAQIAARIAGEVVGNGEMQISGVTSADRAGEGELTFAENAKYFAAAEKSSAAAVIVGEAFPNATKSLIRVANVRVAIAEVLRIFFAADPVVAGIHETAQIHPTAIIDPTAQIGPNCVVAARARVGARSLLDGGNHIGADCVLGDDVALYPNVVLYARTKIGNRVTIHAGTVIGSDGYGYVFDRGRHLKVLQVGNVVIEDDVEIGANAAIDRAAFGSTLIGTGTKIDNLVHVAHNVAMGKHCLIMGQAGFAGSTHLGDYTVIASQSGVAGHVADGETVLGIPALPHQQTKRQWVAQQQLPEMLRRLRDLEKQVNQLRDQSRTASDSSSR
jgi:UDP-3-O-[3-hydroxymyristoyl] glucosamine N-acyltransferase